MELDRYPVALAAKSTPPPRFPAEVVNFIYFRALAGKTPAIVLCAALSWGSALTGDNASSVPSPFADEVVYLIMIDRFHDGKPSNNLGGVDPRDPAALDRDATGFDPYDYGYFQGGDFAGVEEKLDYIRGLGVTAIWLTPVCENKVAEYGSAGYHGYWTLDFTDTDPHFGSKDELRALVDAVHARGMKIYLDIVVNHTANVIHYADGDYGFRPDPPHPVTIPGGGLRAKRPLWLNNPAYYHNLGDYMSGRRDEPLYGESSLKGDFFGLDDLATEMPEVADGMIGIYAGWMREFRFDGFRLDTAKHVDLAFWRAFTPAMPRIAREEGIADFRVFGEVSDEPGKDGRPLLGQRFLSAFIHEKAMPSVLDFDFRLAALGFAAGGGPPRALADFFGRDGWYNVPGASAHDLPTFLGNHDLGRVGFAAMRANPGESRDDWLKRSILAHALMFFARGVPVVYYGDEQGFTGGGDGGDKYARQCMFPNSVPEYRGEPVLGTERRQGGMFFDSGSEPYGMVRELSSLRRRHPALRRGAQIARLADESAGLFAFSRIWFDVPREYVAVFNNSTSPRSGKIPTFSPAGAEYVRLFPDSLENAVTEERGLLPVSLPGLSARLYRASAPIPDAAAAPAIALTVPGPEQWTAFRRNDDGIDYPERIPLAVSVRDSAPGAVRFFLRAGGGGELFLGEDREPPYVVYFDPVLLSSSPPARFRAEYRNVHGRECGAETVVE
ncbi:MAG: alpha-amylase [Planctomycetota bacterium]|nr:alpha-amylase [Planctomycetota bacterium]